MALGTADLIAYFVLRAHALLNPSGQTGLIATNTVAQGDTREVGLDQVVADGIEIRQAIKSKPWPSKSAALEYSAVWTSRRAVDPEAERLIDGVAVGRITPFLNPASRVSGNPKRLVANSNIQFEGSKVYGAGFTMNLEQADQLVNQDLRNTDVIFPYLNGHDLNSRPDCSAGRWVIDFHDWPEERAKSYAHCYEQVFRLVRPERLKLRPDNKARERWWQYERRRPDLYKAIENLDRVLVIARVTKYFSFTLVPRTQVFDSRLIVFASDSLSLLCILSSAPHEDWSLANGTTHEARPTYSPERCFETFPCPDVSAETEALGRRLDTFRRELMLARQTGLTKMYNLVHDPRCKDSDIAELREIHRQIDRAVVHAYGWDDLDLDHGFHETRQGIRYTVGPVARQEILDSLLELNHERYDAEVAAGLHKTTKKASNSEMRLF